MISLGSTGTDASSNSEQIRKARELRDNAAEYRVPVMRGALIGLSLELATAALVLLLRYAAWT